MNIPGGVYHVMARGNEKQAIYLDDEDRELFLDLFEKTVRRCRWECLAYCLMGNHYHLVIRTPLPNLSRGMRLVNGGYASRVNSRYQRDGHLFQGRFRSVLVRSSDHLLIVIKYVLRNPVVAGLCPSPEDWQWSSYRATVGCDSSGLLAPASTLVWFGDEGESRERFARFIANDNTDGIEDTLAPAVEFPSQPDDSSRPRPSVEELLTLQPGAAGVALAYRQHGFSLAQIASVLGRSRSTVGRLLVAYEAEQMLESATWH